VWAVLEEFIGGSRLPSDTMLRRTAGAMTPYASQFTRSSRVSERNISGDLAVSPLLVTVKGNPLR
jgi:hypothetical protein